MKAFIVLIGILASFRLQSTVFGIELNSTNKEDYLKEINELRRNTAKKYKIPNMYKLFWDDALEAKAQMNNSRGDKETMRIHHRDLDPNLPFISFDTNTPHDLVQNRKEKVEKYKTQHMGALEELTPGQQRIGCFPKTYTDDYLTLCFLGPEGTGNSWNIPQGEPGTVCDRGFENDDGLCSPAQSTTPQPKIIGPKPTAPPKASRLGSDSDSKPARDSDLPTDGASYARIGTAFLFLISMIF